MARFILKDPFYKKAKQEGFRARSAYKLKEIEDRFHLVHKGDAVLDLGCSPGSFLQVLSGMVGEKGTVIGIDILPTPPLPPKNMTTIEADIRETDVPGLLSSFSMTAVDTVTCDIAPNLSGIRGGRRAHRRPPLHLCPQGHRRGPQTRRPLRNKVLFNGHSETYHGRAPDALPQGLPV